jgi:hypothetical protein
MGKFVDWVERAAKDRIEFQVSCIDAIQRKTDGLFKTLLTGAGGAMAYAVHLYSAGQVDSALVAGMATISAYLFGLAAWLLRSVIRPADVYWHSNSPDNLMGASALGLAKVKRWELENLEKYITENNAHLSKISKTFQIVGVAATCTPLVPAVIWCLVYALCYLFGGGGALLGAGGE